MGDADDLDGRLGDPGFTPSAKQVPALVERIARGSPAIARAAALALGRVQSAVVPRIELAMKDLDATARRDVVLALGSRRGRAEDDALVTLLERTIADEDPRVRSAAARTLGKIGGERAEAAVSRALDTARTGPERRALVAALGKMSGPTARSALEAQPDDPEVAKARLMAARTALRDGAASSIDLDARLDDGTVAWTCRRGLEDVLGEEVAERLGAHTALEIHEGRVEARWRGSLAPLATPRTAISFGVSFDAARRAGEDDPTAVARLLASPAAASLLRRATRGPIRYRIAWPDGAKRRAATWQVATEVPRLAPDLVNDPTDSAWDVVARPRGDRVAIDLVPNVPDERFAYRVADIPAASHPTIAAALARVAGARADDVVWDPFVGSGLELCERALLGPYRALHGSDLDMRALEIASRNLARAGAERATLRHIDASSVRIPGLSAVITNPPMGRRVRTAEDLGPLLVAVLEAAVATLERGGRIVLLSPKPRTTERAADRLGLDPILDRRVDMGGFDAVMQRFDRRRPLGRGR